MPQSSYSDIYATALYTTGEGLCLWNPSPLRLGDVGFVRDGTFYTLFNCIDGPPSSLPNAANIELATRSSQGFRSRTCSLLGVADDAMQVDGPAAAAAALSPSNSRSSGSELVTDSGGRSLGLSLRQSSRIAAAAAGGGVLSLFSPPPTTASSLSRRRPSPRPDRSSTPPDGSHPPLPLEVDQEVPKIFDMGPRMSQNYRCLDVGVGVSLPGAPVSGKISFETSGGDDAILIPRVPTERSVLRHIGVLKAYVKTHRKWIHECYGKIEDIDVDELALIYGQDRTSDWGVGVSRDSSRGARVEFEIFSAAQTGFWGSWSHSLSASQRGPHRAAPQTTSGEQPFPAALPTPAPSSAADQQGEGGMDVDAQVKADGIGEVSFSFKKGGRNNGGGGGDGAKTIPQSGFRWAPHNSLPADQSIIIRRVTARTSLGLGFLPARLKAAAEPKDPERGAGSGRASSDDEDERPAATVAASSSSGRSSPCQLEAKAGAVGVGSCWTNDPLEALHRWMHREDARVQVSIASDDDCLRLLSLLSVDGDRDGEREASSRVGSLAEVVALAASRYAAVEMDEDGVAMLKVELSRCPSSSSVAVAVQGCQTWTLRGGAPPLSAAPCPQDLTQLLANVYLAAPVAHPSAGPKVILPRRDDGSWRKQTTAPRRRPIICLDRPTGASATFAPPGPALIY